MTTTDILSQIHTPFDDIIPVVDDPTSKFYIDAMRIYLALSSGTLSFEDALEASELLKNNPEFARHPTNPVQVPINDVFAKKIIENLKTIKKFNLVTPDSVRSAYSFVFLVQDAPISSVDLTTLTHLVQNPLSSITNIAKQCDLSPRTVSRSIDRLRERHYVRFSAFLDYSAWGVNTILLFFSPRTDVDWPSLEDELIAFPFIKTMLKTSMAETGYISFNVPGDKEKVKEFLGGIKKISGDVFDYTSIHHEVSIGGGANISLFRNGEWQFPQELASLLTSFDTPASVSELTRVVASGLHKEFTQADFEIASLAKLSSRASPSDLLLWLERRNIDTNPKKIATTLRKLYSKGLMKPYTDFSIGLSSNYCFEIVCNQEWRSHIISVLSLLPYVIFLESPRGLILWITSPGNHQVEYYQLFRALEQQQGVESVQSIMTIRAKGSRSILDLSGNWIYSRGHFSVPSESLDISKYISL